MKSLIKNILQKLLGMERYLDIFAVFIIRTLRFNKREGDFLYFMKMIKEDGIILDIGANIGVMTYYLAKHHKKSKVYSFEPVPLNIGTLERIVKKYKLTNVEICRYALGDEQGEAEIVMPEVDHVKMQGLSHIVHKSISEFNEGSKFKVPIHRLDDLDFLKDTDKKITAIKLDVENFEYFVLKGGKELISKHRPLIYSELWDNENRIKCFELMQTLNYSIKILSDNKLIPFDANSHQTQNFFFVPE